MFIGMNYIDGDFLPHRSDFPERSCGNVIGWFPETTETEQQEAQLAAEKALISWSKLVDRWKIYEVTRKIKEDSVLNVTLNLYESKEIADFKTFLDFMFVETKMEFNQVVTLEGDHISFIQNVVYNLIKGNVVIIKVTKYNSLIQETIKLFYDLPPGVVNLLHFKGKDA